MFEGDKNPHYTLDRVSDKHEHFNTFLSCLKKFFI